MQSSMAPIHVPEKFPNILQSYVKDVIRTQPYDLLRWSATYFRCIANDAEPPVKIRLETNEINGLQLSKGYLRTLIKQLGTGYYVNRDVLQNHWEGLCLPQDELWKYLSICRMLHWDQVHWLKVLAVMAGTLTKDFRSTIELLCELLTDGPEGGPNPIPLWIFAICYLNIAELDCSERQEFRDGRKVLEYGEIEPETTSMTEPVIISTASFRETIANEWKQCAEFKMVTKVNKEKIIHESYEPQASPRITNLRLSSDFRFGNYCDAIKQSMEFESIISILSDIEEKQLQGSSSVINSSGDTPSEKSSTGELFDAKINAIERNVIKEIGAPWSWMHQFAIQNTELRSYNFLEKAAEKNSESFVDNNDNELDTDNYDDDTGTMIGVKATNNIACDFNCVVEPIPGIGGLISIQTTQQLLNYLKYRSKDENGMVFPRHFREENCPNLIDD